MTATADAKPTVVIEAAKPYVPKDGNATSAPAVDEESPSCEGQEKTCLHILLKTKWWMPREEQFLNKASLVPEQVFTMVPIYEKWTVLSMFLNAVMIGVLVTSTCGINMMNNSLEGNFLQSIFSAPGASQLIYHGMMDGPLRDNKGNYLAAWDVGLRGSMCGVMTTANLALAIYVHHNMGVYKFIMSAACWGSVAIYAAFFGMWFLAPVHFVVITGTVLHTLVFSFYIIARTSPIAMPYAVMVMNMSIVSLYGWSMRVQLDDTASMFWGTVMTPLISSYRRIAFIQIIGGPSSWPVKILMLVSNVCNACLTPDVKTILYTKMGMKPEIYDVNAMYMLDALQWCADVKFVVTMPVLLILGNFWDLDTATSGVVSNGTVWPLFKNNFGIIWGLFTAQLLLSEGVVYCMKWASKYVNVNRSRNSKRESHMQWGVSGAKGQAGRYYYSQFREDAKYYHPWIGVALECTQVMFSNFGMDDLYLL